MTPRKFYVTPQWADEVVETMKKIQRAERDRADLEVLTRAYAFDSRFLAGCGIAYPTDLLMPDFIEETQEQ